MKNKTKDVEPMDDSAFVHAVGTPAVNNQRPCWAAQTMVDEFTELFPETNHEFSGYNGRNTAVSVIFDFSMLDEDSLVAAQNLILCTRVDPRVMESVVDEDRAAVDFWNVPTTYDSREPFGFGEALGALEGDPDDE